MGAGHRDLRFQTYSAIVHGATGIWFYSYSGSYTVNPGVNYSLISDYFRDNIAPLSVELKNLSTYLLSETFATHLWNYGTGAWFPVSTNDIHYIVKYCNNEMLIIVANVNDGEKDIYLNFNSLPINDKTKILKYAERADVLFENGRTTIPVQNGVLSDHIGAFGVHIYKISAACNTSADYDQLKIAKQILNANGSKRYAIPGGTWPTPYCIDNPPCTPYINDSYWNVTAMTRGDFDGNGKYEDVIALSSASHWETALIMDGDGVYSVLYHKYGTDNNGNYFPALSAGDENGDGKDELIIAKQIEGAFGSKRYRLPVGRIPPDNILDTLLWYQSDNYWNVTALAHGDFNGCGKKEIAIALSTPNHWETSLIIDGQGVYSVLYHKWSTDNGNNYFSALSAGDEDGDGKDELIIAKQLDGANGSVRYRINGGPIPPDNYLNTLQPYQTDTYWRVTAMTHGDFDANGKKELVIGLTTLNQYHSSLIMMGDGVYFILYDKYDQNNSGNYFSALSSGK
jgi:hypothetical protein